MIYDFEENRGHTLFMAIIVMAVVPIILSNKLQRLVRHCVGGAGSETFELNCTCVSKILDEFSRRFQGCSGDEFRGW